jgi:hypothetical protein
VQSDETEQETPESWMNSAPATLGLAMIDHAVPFHRSMSVFCVVGFVSSCVAPTATQRVLVGHETLRKELSLTPGGFGLATTDQTTPFHCSTSVCARCVVSLMSSPTAKHVVPLHETSSKKPGPPAGFGLVTRDQLVPFQRTTNGLDSVPSYANPTAKHVVPSRHVIPERLPATRPGGFAASTTDHAVPFHRSMRVEYTPAS